MFPHRDCHRLKLHSGRGLSFGRDLLVCEQSLVFKIVLAYLVTSAGTCHMYLAVTVKR